MQQHVGGCYVDYIYYIFEDIMVAHGDDETEVIWDINPERVRWVGVGGVTSMMT